MPGNHCLLIMNEVLDNRNGVAKDIVILNTGAAIYTSGLADDLTHGKNLTREGIDSGAARIKLMDLVIFTNDICSDS